jgi:group II intron reverse transcriptase/maturase
VATLVTPPKLRELQRALCQRAKKEPNFRAYALYDKVYRDDVLAHAYALTKANGGAPGVDGVSFEDIEMGGREGLLQELREELKAKRYRPGPVRRVEIPKLSGGTRSLGIPNIRDRVVQTAAKLLLEPLFEADFDRDSYGFRPKKDGHQALEAIREELGRGMHWIIDADITKYFDSISHDRLMKAVAERVVDGAMLALVKMFLEAPIVDEEDGGRPRRNDKGTPQGGVISPLLANIYLNLLDRNFRRHAEAGELHGRIIRYADDFVLLAPERPDRELGWVQQLMERLGLHLHPDKTRVLDVTEANFDFLGHEVRWTVRKTHLDISRRSLARIKDEVRRRTRRPQASLATVIEELNQYITGARNYFREVRRHTLEKLDYFVAQRLARWWKRKHALERPAWSLVWRGPLRQGLARWYGSQGRGRPKPRLAGRTPREAVCGKSARTV